MPEAVIVATGRSPIGRAGKGSLVNVRPDDMLGYIVQKVLEKVPELPHDQIEDLICGCGFPHGETGMNVGRLAVFLSGPAGQRARHHRQSLLRIQPAVDPDGLPRHQGG